MKKLFSTILVLSFLFSVNAYASLFKTTWEIEKYIGSGVISLILVLLIFFVAPIWMFSQEARKQKRSFILGITFSGLFIVMTYLLFATWVLSLFLLAKFFQKYEISWYFSVPGYIIIGLTVIEYCTRIQNIFSKLMDNYNDKGIIKTSFNFELPFILKLLIQIFKIKKPLK